MRRTGFLIGNAKPKNYPEEYFARAKLNKNIVALLIGRLRSEDIYHQLKIYPHPHHRSVALGTQAGMLYLILYLTPNTLHNEFVFIFLYFFYRQL